MAHLEFEFPFKSWTPDRREILVAKLFQFGFEGFSEKDELLQAYIEEGKFSEKDFNVLLDEFRKEGMKVQYRFHITPEQNWNEEWEKKFEPVLIKEKVLIRAPFHDPGEDLECTLVIEPKMSFGTGHHYSTRLMIEEMMNLELASLSVLDMGCGTGVLGIYACHRGARRVLGVDNDQWAFENAIENVEQNSAGAMEVRLGDAGSLGEECFDVVLANITRNILVRDMTIYAAHLVRGGNLLISGILSEDVLYVLNAAYASGLEHTGTKEDCNWILLTFHKSL